MADRDKRNPIPTPPGVAIQIAPSAVPRENWDEPKSGVHAVVDETQLDTVERITRDIRKTGGTTAEVLERHEGTIHELTGRVASVEGLAVSIKAETQIQTTKLDKIERTHEVHGAKIDTMLKILDPSAPQRVRELVATELRYSDRAATQAEQADGRKFRLTALQGVIAICTSLITAGVVGALVQSHC